MEEVTIIGSGRTGRGMIGELFDKDGRYHLNFADIDRQLVNLLRKKGKYSVHLRDLIGGEDKIREIENFSIYDINQDRKEYIDKLANSRFVITSLFPEAFDSAINDIVESIKLRYKLHKENFVNIILSANYVGLMEYFVPRIKKRLTDNELEYLDNYIAILGSNANRKVTYLKDKNDLTLDGDNKDILKVNRGFKLPNDYKLPGFIIEVDDIERVMIEKIWSENLQHIGFAFLGNYKGYNVINEAVNDPWVVKKIDAAWEEARSAMKKVYDIPIPNDKQRKTVLDKFASPFFKDKLHRIGRAEKRKLKKNDRLLGPAYLCLNNGLPADNILKLVAYGFCYNDPFDRDSQEVLSFVKQNGIKEAVKKYCGLNLTFKNDRVVLDKVVNEYNKLRK